MNLADNNLRAVLATLSPAEQLAVEDALRGKRNSALGQVAAQTPGAGRKEKGEGMSFKPSISFNLAWLWVSAAVFVLALFLPPNKFWPTLAVVALALFSLAFLALALLGGLFLAVCYSIWRNRAEAAGTFAEPHKKLSAGGKMSANAEAETTEDYCAFCDRRAPTLPGYLYMVLSGGPGIVCAECSSLHAPGLYKSLEEVLRIDTFPADIDYRE